MSHKQSAIIGTLGIVTILAGTVSAQSLGSADAQPFLHLAQAAPAWLEAPSRPARSREVRVRVLLLSEKLRKDNPDEFIEVEGERYVHFRSPNLKSPARPLADPRLRYPTGEFTQKNGAVILQLLIDEEGGILRSDVVCAAPPFAKSALESVEGPRFQPAVAREGPVKSYMWVEFGYGKGYPCGRIPD